jgi:hypothetical protein
MCKLNFCVQKPPPATNSSRKTAPASRQSQLASTPEKHPSGIPVAQNAQCDINPADLNNNASQTPRQRAHDILADKVHVPVFLFLLFVLFLFFLPIHSC